MNLPKKPSRLAYPATRSIIDSHNHTLSHARYSGPEVITATGTGRIVRLASACGLTHSMM